MLSNKYILPIIIILGVLLWASYFYNYTGSLYSYPQSMDQFDQSTFYDLSLEYQKNWNYPPNKAYYYSPLYPQFLALLSKVFSGKLSYIYILQGILFFLSLPFLYQFTARLWNTTAGFICLALSITYGPFAIYSFAMLSESLLIPFVIFFMYSFQKALIHSKSKHFLISGLWFILACFLKPVLLLYIPFALLSILYFSAPTEKEKQHRILKAFLFLLIPTIALSLSLLRNWTQSGEWVLITQNGLNNYLIGNCQNASGLYGTPNGPLLYPTQRAFWDLFLTKTLLFFSNYNWPQNIHIHIARQIYPALGYFHFFFVGLASIGLGSCLFLEKRKHFYFLSFLFLQILWVILFFITARFRLLATLCFIISSSIGLAKIFQNPSFLWKSLKGVIFSVFTLLFLLFFSPKTPNPILAYHQELFSRMTVHRLQSTWNQATPKQLEKLIKQWEKVCPKNPVLKKYQKHLEIKKENLTS